MQMMKFSSQREILNTLSLLEPKRPVGFEKIRLGRAHDGGYVMLDDFRQVSKAISLGISDDDSWDVDMANRGLNVHQYDHSVSHAPTRHERLKFNQLKIEAVTNTNSISLSTALDRMLPARGEYIVLKMDIEGSEWEIFAHTPKDSLQKFSQIICEFHGLKELENPTRLKLYKSVFSKLNFTHQSIHVHGNNYGDFINISNIPVPDVLEVTYANKQIYRFRVGTDIYPTAIDLPNNPKVPDIFLGTFKFPKD